ncbi:hypothetical protein [Kitasatospora camelliae]|uniref:Tetratricopeptide repeat protein n=1 Tax=Kitasatospora camelliae TaxID=3156397 RepID=A0AAU8K248_9ACTN
MTTELTKASDLLDAGDRSGAVRALRSAVDSVPSAELAPLVGRLAESAGLDDLAGAAAALVAAPERAGALYDFGYACVGRGLAFLAVPALTEALDRCLSPRRGILGLGRDRRLPSTLTVVQELATALEDEERHAAAADLLARHDDLLADWPGRYLRVYNALMDGRPEEAAALFDRLAAPDGTWQPAADRIRRSLARTTAAAPADRSDLRGWHFALTGGILTTLSPYGFRAGMNGRWGYLQLGYESLRYGLERLRTVLDAAGTAPRAVALLPDRNSRILGLAAAGLFGLPAEEYRPGAEDTLVVAYDLNEADREVLRGLHRREPGQILFEHATCWTDTPVVSADVCTLLAQVAVAPWEATLRVDPETQQVEKTAPDERPAEEIAEDIRTAAPVADEGDGETPSDPDETLAAFTTRIRTTWLHGPRDRVRSAGPVRSSRFH